MSHDLKSFRKIKRCNVNEAIKLVMKSNTKRKRPREKEETASDQKIARFCRSFQSNTSKRRLSVIGFSKSLALSEMQTYVAHHDWRHAVNLLPRLLDYPIEVESLVWKYVFMILLHTNDSSCLRKFFQLCIGSRSEYNDTLLKKLLLLPVKEDR